VSLENLLAAMDYNSNRTKDRRLESEAAIQNLAASMVPPGGGGGGRRGGGGGGMASGKILNRKGFYGGLRPTAGGASQHGGYGWASWAGDISVPGSGDLGNAVSAWKDGKVVSVKKLRDSYGKHIRVRHPDGSETLYAHLSRIGVRRGQRVRGGQVIGKVGSTGNSTGPHLHFEIKK
jgi:murein DD-endopeptidase MepM/ murein hydrolase activator NlpD